MSKFHFMELETFERKDKIPRREPNMFISYRKEMMRYKPYNIPMTKFSKLVSEKWKQLSEEEKTELQRQYQINSDQKRKNTVHVNDIDTDRMGESSNTNNLSVNVTNDMNYPVSECSDQELQRESSNLSTTTHDVCLANNSDNDIASNSNDTSSSQSFQGHSRSVILEPSNNQEYVNYIDTDRMEESSNTNNLSVNVTNDMNYPVSECSDQELQRESSNLSTTTHDVRLANNSDNVIASNQDTSSSQLLQSRLVIPEPSNILEYYKFKYYIL